MREEFDNLMRQGAKELSVELSGSQMDGFYRYYELLTEWNKVMNLTAITELHEVVTKHFLDSLSLVKAVSAGELEEARILDLGTGAGFPGIPLKIAFPDMKVTLLDSLNKRIRFLQQVVSELNLSEVEAVHGRAEDYGRQREFRENYDFCVSRAVANFSTLAEYCLPFVRKGGYFISYKSSDVEKELEACGQNYSVREERILVRIDDTLSAIPLVGHVQDKIEGFEVIQGTMDDVFLNVTM